VVEFIELIINKYHSYTNDIRDKKRKVLDACCSSSSGLALNLGFGRCGSGLGHAPGTDL
jgi:hypothetical protein